MKIIYVAPIRLPTEKAHGIQIMETCAALTHAGCDVELVVPTRKTSIKEDPFAYYNIADRFTITRIPVIDMINMGGIGFIATVLLFVFRSLFYVQRARPGVVYTRDPITASIFILMGFRIIHFEVHAVHTRVPRFILRRCAEIVAITNGLKEWYINRGVSADKIIVAPDAVALELFDIHNSTDETIRSTRSRFGLPQDTKIALYVGSINLYAWKGVDVVIEAAVFAPDVIWVLVGGTVEEGANLLVGATSNVRVLPRIGRAEIPALLRSSDVLLLPNRSGDPASDRYTSPMKLFEYMASGVPIVASDLPSICEVLDEHSAYLVKPNDPEALAKVVHTVLEFKSEASARALVARTEVENYTWDARARVILKSFEGK